MPTRRPLLLTAGMPFRTISRARVYTLFPDFPEFSYDAEADTDHISFPEARASYILTVEGARSQEDQFMQMAKEVTALATTVSATGLLFMGAGRVAWRYQSNRDTEMREASDFLAAPGVGPRFNGGIAVGVEELPMFVQRLMYLVASHAALSEIYFIDEAKAVLGHLCRYGNLHLYALSVEAEKLLRSFVHCAELNDITATGCTYTPYDAQGTRVYVSD